MTDKPFIETAERAADDLNMLGSLAGYAGEAAARVLLENWRAAIRDGSKGVELLPDIEEAINELRRFRSLILDPGLMMDPAEPAKGGAEPRVREMDGGGWRCDRCDHEWSAMCADGDVPEMHDCAEDDGEPEESTCAEIKAAYAADMRRGAEPAEPDYEAECRAAGWTGAPGVVYFAKAFDDAEHARRWHAWGQAFTREFGATFDSFRECWATNINPNKSANGA